MQIEEFVVFFSCTFRKLSDIVLSRVMDRQRIDGGNVPAGNVTVGGLFTCDDYVRLIS